MSIGKLNDLSRFSATLVALVVVVGLATSPVRAEGRFHLAGKLGVASVDENFGPPVLGWRVDDEDTAASIALGYGLHRFLDIQVGYHDFGSFDGEPRPCPPGQVCPQTLAPALVPVFPAEAEFTGVSLVLVPRWPINERVSAYGKLGVLDWRSRLTESFAGQVVERPSERDLLLGLGAEYVFESGLGVLLELERTELLETVNLGASWRF